MRGRELLSSLKERNRVIPEGAAPGRPAPPAPSASSHRLKPTPGRRSPSISPSTGSAGNRSSADSPTRTTSPLYHPALPRKRWSPPESYFRAPQGARVRLLATWASNKNDPNDALPVAVAALRSRIRRQVSADDHAAVLRVWSRRHRDLGRARNQAACRLHAAGCELVPGGVPEEITAAQATRILGSAKPSGAAGQARGELAAELLADMRRLDEQMRESKKKLAAAVSASGTSLTELFGVGPFAAATVIGDVAGVARFASRDHFAAYNGTAPAGVSSGNRKTCRLSLRGNRRVNHAIRLWREFR